MQPTEAETAAGRMPYVNRADSILSQVPHGRVRRMASAAVSTRTRSDSVSSKFTSCSAESPANGLARRGELVKDLEPVTLFGRPIGEQHSEPVTLFKGAE
jgi:hypothetical protein